THLKAYLINTPQLYLSVYTKLLTESKNIPTVFMEIESISNKLSNLVKNMRGYFNTSPLNKKKPYNQGFS
ncbi:hypothetical protein K1I89_06545, partial [Streptococcus mitis]|nr:hypothetical protein [Streptococcus mitis]MBZ2109331.1 hypothetical protein [Streptococcus mitis]